MKSVKATGKSPRDADFLNHTSSVTEQFADYDAKQLAAMSVTSMIKTIAQMKNPRRGHDAQGRLKKVNIDASAEGYSNFMAPMRVRFPLHERLLSFKHAALAFLQPNNGTAF